MLEGFQARNIYEAEISTMSKLRCKLVEELFPIQPPANLAVPLGVLVRNLKFKGYIAIEVTYPRHLCGFFTGKNGFCKISILP
jgi:hypothetical protein